MAVFKFVVSDKKKSYQVERDQKDAPLLGKKIGDEFHGDFLGLAGYTFVITGGSDKDGFPMRTDMEGTMRRRLLTTKGVGFRAKKGGLRRRKMLRGNLVGADIAQINCKVVKAGDKPLEELLGKKEATEEKKE
jgi:small subunit ribosomal protein S6e